MNVNSNILLGIFIVIILGAIAYYISQNDKPVPNDGAINNNITNFANAQYGNVTTTDDIMTFDSRTGLPITNRPARPLQLDNRKEDAIRGDLVADIVSQYTVEDRPMEGGTGTFTSMDPRSDTHGPFENYGHKRQLNMKKMEQAFADDEYDARDPSYRPHRMRKSACQNIKKNHLPPYEPELGDESESDSEEIDPRDFMHRRRKYTKRTEDDIKDQFDVMKLLPNEYEDDWFEPLLTTKKIRGTHLLHPKVHMGVNTVGSSLRNGTHDLRGDIPNPKINVSPWNNSTIEPDTNIKGICSPI